MRLVAYVRLLLLVVTHTAESAFWLQEMPSDYAGEIQQANLNLNRCAQLCVKRSCLFMTHDAARGCRLAVGGPPPPKKGVVMRIRSAPPPLMNVALLKPTRASTTLGPGYAVARANDGSLNGFFHSDKEDYPFMVVDLGTAFSIEGVRILPRLNYNSTRFSGIDVRTGLTEVAGPDFGSYSRLVLFPGPVYEPVTWVAQNLTQPVLGRFLSVQRTVQTVSADACLEITELEVFARQANTV